MKKISVQRGKFDVSEEISDLVFGTQGVGAVLSFVGVVRAYNDADPLQSMTLEYFPGMTERELERIADEAMIRWDLLGVTIIHRIGELMPSEQIVLVLTASAHRHPAFEGGEFLMDYLKTKAPFWKEEKRMSGTRWIEARSSDEIAAARWDKI